MTGGSGYKKARDNAYNRSVISDGTGDATAVVREYVLAAEIAPAAQRVGDGSCLGRLLCGRLRPKALGELEYLEGYKIDARSPEDIHPVQ
jgi:hypothetical protein